MPNFLATTYQALLNFPSFFQPNQIPFLSPSVPSGTPTPYCQFGQSCFPGVRELAAFNASVGGKLQRTRPVEEVCYDGTYDDAACTSLHLTYKDPTFRSSHPSTLQYLNWEMLPSGSGCRLPPPGAVGPKEGCKQGSVPGMVVGAGGESDVVMTVKWAREHRLRLRIRNVRSPASLLGHDFLGRSSASGSITLLTQNLTSTSFLPSFAPSCSPSRRFFYLPHHGSRHHPRPEAVIMAGSGVTNAQLYEFADKSGVGVVGGASASVGIAGGVVLGGGHGPLGPLWGMAIDNVMQFEVVTADGKIRNASKCENPDLFWALKGGGGGTFGVALRVWFKTHKKLHGVVGVFGTIKATTRDSYTKMVQTLLAMMPQLQRAGISGYAEISYPMTSVAFIHAYTYGTPDASKTLVAFKPLFGLAASDPAIVPNITTATMTSWYEFFIGPLVQAFGILDTVGVNLLLGSRLVPKAVIDDTVARERVANTLSALQSPAIIHLVAGGEVSRISADSASLNPAWRAALLHIDLPVSWPSVPPYPDGSANYSAALAATRIYLTNATQSLARVTGGACYVNEADVDEERWQEVFWGEDHYRKLLKLKRKWDPKGVFSCRSCVGSEFNGY